MAQNEAAVSKIEAAATPELESVPARIAGRHSLLAGVIHGPTHPRISARCWPALWVAWLLTTPGLTASDAGRGPTPESSPAEIRLIDRAGDAIGFSISVNDQLEIPATRLWHWPSGSIEVEGVELTALRRGGTRVLELSAKFQGLVLTLDSMANLQLTIPWGNVVQITPSLRSRWISVDCPEQNRAVGRLALPDGGAVTIPPGSGARVEWFLDGTYFVVGTGAVVGWTAEGQEYRPERSSAPLTGGALKIGQAGVNSLARNRPGRALVVSGALEGAVSVLSEQGQETIANGKEKRLAFSNGSSLVFHHRRDSRGLEWHVEKGLFQIKVAGIPGLEALTWTGQSASLQWKSALKMADLHNRSEEAMVWVTLPSQTRAKVPPGGRFQYSHIDSFTFSAAASGQTVLLQNLATGTETPLFPVAQAIAGGELRTVQKRAQSRKPIRLAWDIGAPLELQGLTTGTVTAPGSETTFEYDATGRLAMVYNQHGELSIMALEGAYRIEVSARRKIFVEVDEGDSVSLAMDLKKGTLRVIAGLANAAMVRIITPDGAVMDLPPAAAMNFNFGRDGSLIATAQGQLVLYEEAGESVDDPSAPIRPVIIQKEDDVSRLPKSPATPEG